MAKRICHLFSLQIVVGTQQARGGEATTEIKELTHEVDWTTIEPRVSAPAERAISISIADSADRKSTSSTAKVSSLHALPGPSH